MPPEFSVPGLEPSARERAGGGERREEGGVWGLGFTQERTRGKGLLFRVSTDD
jgi:hypothetical protein